MSSFVAKALGLIVTKLLGDVTLWMENKYLLWVKWKMPKLSWQHVLAKGSSWQYWWHIFHKVTRCFLVDFFVKTWVVESKWTSLKPLSQLERRASNWNLNPRKKYRVFPSDDLKVQILYEECEFGNYVILLDKDSKSTIDKSIEQELWNMEFDGSASNVSSGEGVVLISPFGECFPPF